MTGNNKTRVALSDAEQSELSDLAQAVFDEYQRDGRIDPVSVIRANRITLNFGRYGDAFDGLLEHLSGRFHVFCNLDRVASPGSTRARFTLAHELGHFFIDDHRNALAAGAAPSHPSLCEYESKLLVEQQADAFAANLLMTEPQFRQKARGLGTGLTAIRSLAHAFTASVTSTAIRYASLGIEPCVVIKWNSGRVSWKWVADSLWNDGFRKIIDAKAEIVAGSATAKAFAGEQPPNKGFFESVTTAAYWFPSVNLGGWKDALFVEHAMSLGRFGVVTVLTSLDRPKR